MWTRWIWCALMVVACSKNPGGPEWSWRDEVTDEQIHSILLGKWYSNSSGAPEDSVVWSFLPDQKMVIYGKALYMRDDPVTRIPRKFLDWFKRTGYRYILEPDRLVIYGGIYDNDHFRVFPDTVLLIHSATFQTVWTRTNYSPPSRWTY